MRQFLAVAVVFLPLSLVEPCSAQEPRTPLRLGLHVATNASETPPDMVRVGGQALIPLVGRLDAYPAFSVIFDRASWEASANLRFRPIPSSSDAAPVYLGGGGAVIDWGPVTRFYDVLLAGLEIPIGPFRPYAEIQFLDPLDRLITGGGDFGVQLYFGVNRVIR
jgi:hypothetical protein